MKVLVSGAGMAGLSAGISLGQFGFSVTLVERAKHLRVNGSPIDIRGDSVRMAQEMGVLDAIRARRVTMSEVIVFVNRDGKTLVDLPQEEIGDSKEDVEIPREDLGDILYRALPKATEVRFGDWIQSLDDDGSGVAVTFKSGRTGRAGGRRGCVCNRTVRPRNVACHHRNPHPGRGAKPPSRRS